MVSYNRQCELHGSTGSFCPLWGRGLTQQAWVVQTLRIPKEKLFSRSLVSCWKLSSWNVLFDEYFCMLEAWGHAVLVCPDNLCLAM